MTEQENKAVMTIALMAAFADGLKDERERAAVKQVADALGSQGGVDLPALYRDALIAKPDLAQLTVDAALARVTSARLRDGGRRLRRRWSPRARGEGIPRRGWPSRSICRTTVTGDLDRRASEMARGRVR